MSQFSGFCVQQSCACCDLVDTTVMIRGEPRCSLCRELCAHDWPCNVRYWLSQGREGLLETKTAEALRKSEEENP
jgi:hypothetical protein